MSQNKELPKRLHKDFVDILPESFEAPQTPITLVGFNQGVSGLIWHAQFHELIGESQKEINKFIFYTIKSHSLTETERAAKQLPSGYKYSGKNDSLPHPLNLIMQAYSSDQRIVLAEFTNFLD